MKKTQEHRLFDYLLNGNKPTTAVLKARLKFKNPTAVVSNLRKRLKKNQSIDEIYTNTRTNSKGKQVKKYAVGVARGLDSRFYPFPV